MDNKRTGEGGDTLLYYIGGPTPASPRVAMGIAPLKGHESIFNTFSKGPFRPGREGEGGNGKRNRTQEAREEAKFILIMPSNKEEKTAKRD